MIRIATPPLLDLPPTPPRLRALPLRFAHLAIALLIGASGTLWAQDANAAPPPARAAAAAQGTVAPLERRVSLDLHNTPLDSVLQEIDRQAQLGLTYTPRVVPLAKRVTLRRSDITAREALEQVLKGTGARVVVRPTGTVLIVKDEDGKDARKTAERAPAAISLIWGRVVDSARAQPLAGAVVSVRGTAEQATTNDSGYYALKHVSAGVVTVVARMLGYQPAQREVAVADSQRVRVDFALQMGMARLQEMVTTATGPRRRLEIGNDITVLNADSIVRTQPVSSVTDLLDGRVPGMVVERTSGAPGDPARIRLRGATSPRMSNDPIVIVDGVRVNADQSSNRAGNLAGLKGFSNGTQPDYAAPSPLDYIDPQSIETIEVVKGPSAATLYGQDAANGVIVITTKKGRAGPPRWTVGMERGMTEMAGKYPDLMLRWGHQYGDDTPLFCPVNNHAGGDPAGVACLADSTSAFQILSDPSLTVLDHGSHSGLNVGVSGGTDALTYSVTGSDLDDIGLMRLPDYEVARYRAEEGRDPPDWMQRPQTFKRWAATSLLSAHLGQKADVSLSTGLTRETQQRSDLERELGTLMSTYLDQSTGTYYQASGATIRLVQPTTQPLQSYQQRATDVATSFRNSLSLNWRPRSWLTLGAGGGLDYQQRTDEILQPRRVTTNADSDGTLSLGHGTSLMSTVTVRANVTAPLPRGFRLQLATGVQYTGTTTEDLTGSASGLAEGTESLNEAAAITGLNQYSVDQATYGVYIEPSITSNRFSLSTALRFDGASTFGSSTSLPAFPKVSASYLISDEKFFPFKNLFNTLRLRLAYGESGQQPGPVDRLRLYGATTPVWIDGQYVDGQVLAHVGNTTLRPERLKELEWGADADLLDSRLSLGLTGYRKTRIDAIESVPLPPSVYGEATSILQNIGVVRNWGVEASLSAQLVRSDLATWSVSLGMSHDRNVVVRLGQGVSAFFDEGMTRVVPGYPLFGNWVRPILGYADANGDGVLEPSEVLYGDTAVYVGSTLPNYTANLNTTLSLFRGALSVAAGFSYEDGKTQTNQVASDLAPFTRGWNDPSAPISEQIGIVDRYGFSWIQTTNTLRFNSLSVSYNLSRRLAQRFDADAMSLSLIGSNLGLHTNYHGLDPNVNAYATGNAVTDNGVLPQPRTWQIRVNASY
jgi:TonB-linked SusC/RagA family outer membrane protein